MAYENNEKKIESVYSKRIRAGKRRTYFFDVRETRGNDYFLTITESRKRFDDNGYDRHKIFIYKEDFNKFSKALGETIDYVKTDLMPDFDFDAFNHEYNESDGEHVPENAIPANVEPKSEPISEVVIEVETPTIETQIVEAPKPHTPNTDEASASNLASEVVDKW